MHVSGVNGKISLFHHWPKAYIQHCHQNTVLRKFKSTLTSSVFSVSTGVQDNQVCDQKPLLKGTHSETKLMFLFPF